MNKTSKDEARSHLVLLPRCTGWSPLPRFTTLPLTTFLKREMTPEFSSSTLNRWAAQCLNKKSNWTTIFRMWIDLNDICCPARRCLARQGFFSWALEAQPLPTQPPTSRSPLSYGHPRVDSGFENVLTKYLNLYVLLVLVQDLALNPKPYVLSGRELIFNFRRRAQLRTNEKSIRLPSGLTRTGLFSKLLQPYLTMF